MHTHTLTHTNTHVTMGSSKPTVAWRICLGTEYYRANVWTTSGLVKSLHSHKHACISNSHLKLFHELRFEPAWHNTQQQIYLILFLIFSCIMGWKCSSVPVRRFSTWFQIEGSEHLAYGVEWNAARTIRPTDDLLPFPLVWPWTWKFVWINVNYQMC